LYKFGDQIPGLRPEKKEVVIDESEEFNWDGKDKK
jgi:hypothetical protein